MATRSTEFGLEVANPGTVYRTFRRMEKNGLCESEWETSDGGGPPRRRYSITEAGEAYLGLWAEGFEQYRRTMNAFFQFYGGGGRPEQE